MPDSTPARDPFDCPWIRMGQAYLACGSIWEARRAFLASLEDRPHGWAAHYQLGCLDAAAGQWESAFERFVEVVRRAPAVWGAVANLGCVYWFQSDPESAVTCWEKALSLDTRAPEALANLAVAHRVLGRHAEAVQCAERAVGQDPTARAINNLGVLCALAGGVRDALRCFERALALDDSQAAPYHNLARALTLDGQPTDAERVARREHGTGTLGTTVFMGWEFQLSLAPTPGLCQPVEWNDPQEALPRTWILDED